jgi:pyrroline-5-carboxylate reductase
LNVSEYILGFVGCGNMGEAILKGIVDSGLLNSYEITFYDKKIQRCNYISDKYGIGKAKDIDSLVKTSKYLLTAVKPQNILEILPEIKKSFSKNQNRIISIAAGVSTSVFENYLGEKTSVIRIMPNTPALVNMGISAVSKGRYVENDDFDFTLNIIRSLGDYVVLEEKLQNLVTAVSGSGPAYFFLFCKYMIESAAARGMDNEIAEKLVLKTISGAAKMLEKVSPDTDYLIDMVTSPGGTTERAISVFKEMKLKDTVYSAVSSAEDRAVEIQGELSKIDLNK